MVVIHDFSETPTTNDSEQLEYMIGGVMESEEEEDFEEKKTSKDINIDTSDLIFEKVDFGCQVLIETENQEEMDKITRQLKMCHKCSQFQCLDYC